MTNRITVVETSGATSKRPRNERNEHMLFNQLIKDIETKRASLKKWQDALEAFERLRGEEYVPLLQRYLQVRADLVRRLDQVHAGHALAKKDQKMLGELIRDFSRDLLNQAGSDATIQEIFERHGGADRASALTAMQQEIKKAVEERLDIDLGDDVDFSSPAAFEAHVDRVMAAKYEAARNEADDTSESAHLAREAARAEHQTARHAKKAQEVSHSIREVYRKLASALHPDKETDPAERARKTELMKHVNVAYDRRDLLALLTLQLEIEQINQGTIDNIPTTRLRHYNAVLREQLQQLDAELDALQHTFKAQYGISPFEKLTPQGLLPSLRRDMKNLRDEIKAFGADIVAFRDVANVKAWLKAYRALARSNDDDAFFR